MTVPAFNDAKRDRALRGSPMTVYLHLLDVLHPIEWRPIKQFALCASLEMGERTVRDALDVLTRHGYLERQPYTHSDSRLYRLTYERKPEPPTAA